LKLILTFIEIKFNFCIIELKLTLCNYWIDKSYNLIIIYFILGY